VWAPVREMEGGRWCELLWGRWMVGDDVNSCEGDELCEMMWTPVSEMNGGRWCELMSGSYIFVSVDGISVYVTVTFCTIT
jgi:hypothetical protein